MALNYILMVVLAGYSVFNVLAWINGRRARIFGAIAAAVLFILVLIATCMGMGYNEFRYMIEGRFN